jgi:sialidase-1
VQLEGNLPEPVCQASILRLPDVAGRPIHVYVAPDSQAKGRKDKSARRRLTLWLSTDDCATWAKARLIDPGRSSYSDLVPLDQNHVGCLYSAGEATYYGQIRFVRLRVESPVAGN